MKIINFFGFLILILLVNTNAYSKKPLKTDIVFESEYGGIYTIKLPLFSGKGRWQPSFDIINDLSQKNCNQYSKNSYLLVSQGSGPMRIRTNGKIKVNAIKSDQGLIMDETGQVSVSHNHFRFFCGENIEQVLLNFSISQKFFSENIFKFSSLGSSPTGYLQFQNRKYIFNKIQQETKDNIALKLKELSGDQDYKLKVNEQGMVSGNIAKANFQEIINESKKLCKELGFNTESDKYSECILEVMEIDDAYKATKEQENFLITKAKKEENIDLKFNYETSSGQKIYKESKWTKFWKGTAWILSEHGEDIFNVILDLKYGTNYSGYNSSNEVTNVRNTLRCTGQRVGNMIYENCRGGGVWVRCTTTIIGSMAKRRCRQIS